MSRRILRLTIDSRLDAVPLAGEAVHRACQQLGLDEQQCFNVQLCLVEALTNSIRHALGSEPGHPLQIGLLADAEQIAVEVVDSGRPVPHRLRQPRRLEIDPDNLDTVTEGGRGLFLIFSLMDEVEFIDQPGANLLRMTLKRCTPTEP